MRTFTGWRAVGRAMLDARRREGVTAPRTAVDNRRNAPAVELTWTREDGLTVGLWRLRSNRFLRVLAALDLIPADIAYAADERYGQCVKCNGVARWWHEPPFTARWVHVQPWAVTGPNAHRAEVAS